MINYRLLADAQSHYEACGFKYIDVPWTVSSLSLSITQPKGVENFYVKDKCLVASAEQSFLELMRTDQLKTGKYQAITPCFRDEPMLDDIHKQYFMKLELIEISDEVCEDMLKSMVDHAFKFFSKYVECEIVPTALYTYDIVDKRRMIELGSYGMRGHYMVDHEWIYGTGLAEPRFTYVLDTERKHKEDNEKFQIRMGLKRH